MYQLRWWTLAVLCLSLLIVFVGNSSLNVTLPTLARDLHATSSQLQWVVAVYSLVFAGCLFTTGALGDRYGRKGALQIGLMVFLTAAGAATLSHSMWELIACRAVMGLAGALIMPSTLSILINVFPPAERTRAIAIWASFLGAAGAIGPVISGWLLGRFWYGSVFFVNVPIIAVALVAGRFLLPKSRDPEEAPIEPVGAALSTIGIVALVYGLIEAPSRGWLSTTTLGALGVALIVLVAFAFWELRVDEPMLDIRYFKNPAFSTGSGGMILVFLGMYGVFFLITQYFQLVHDYSPLGSALRMLPISPIMLIVAPRTPKMAKRIGAQRLVALGMLGIATGFLLFLGLGPKTSYPYVLFSFLPFIFGLSVTMSPMTASIMSAVPERRAGAGSAMNDATRELGAALGVAVLGSIAASRYSGGLGRAVQLVPEASRHIARSSLADALQVASHLKGSAAVTVANAAKHAFLSGVHIACVTGAILCIGAAAIVTRWLPRDLYPDDDEMQVATLADVTFDAVVPG
jgi:EmrB/QacA subfamily drug resistance transporter